MLMTKVKIENLLYKKYGDKKGKLTIKHEGLTYKGYDPKVIRMSHHGTFVMFAVVLYHFPDSREGHFVIEHMRAENSKNENALIL